MSEITVVSFGGVSALPIRAAEAQGAFASVGITVQHTRTRSSAEVRDGLVEGSVDIAHLAPDNVIAWADGGDPVRAWLAGSNGPISLVARDVTEVTGLRGRRIGVDSAGSGFVVILDRLLERAGIGRDDVELVPLGATRLRYQGLVDGSIDATMLTLPWSSLAAREGATGLGDHRDVAPGLLTSCAASMEGWLQDQREMAVAYGDALATGLAWVADAANGDDAARLLSDDMAIDERTARDVLAAMQDPHAGWLPDPWLDADDLAIVLALRADRAGSPGVSGAMERAATTYAADPRRR